MTSVHIAAVTDWDRLCRQWRALEPQVALSFFQSWTWVGCLAAERYRDPVLVEARDAAMPGLALFNRTRGWVGDTLALHEAGEPARDCPYIEHNAPLGIAPLLPALFRGLAPRRLILSGVDDRTAAAAARAAGWVRILRTQPAPYVDLAADFLPRRSANTRQQIRRSDRAYGGVTVRRAADLAEAVAMLDELANLHQASWRMRGKPGAFANPFFRHFHQALIARGMPRGEIDLLRISAAGRTIGVLYGFRYRGHALAYQSGFDYDAADGARKPGLTCHHAAIRFAAAAGLRRYDFLAGDDRYKRSLADHAVTLHWLEAGSLTDLSLAVRCAASLLRGTRHGTPAARASPASCPPA